MLTEEKKKRIESLTTEEMLCEINRGHRSRFQREAFAYLKCCYQERIAKDDREQNDSTVLPVKKWFDKPFGKVLLMVIAGVIVAFLVYFLGWN